MVGSLVIFLKQYRFLIIESVIIFISSLVISYLSFYALNNVFHFLPERRDSPLVSKQQLFNSGGSDVVPGLKTPPTSKRKNPSTKPSENIPSTSQPKQKSKSQNPLTPVSPPNSEDIYAIRPVIFLGSDTSLDLNSYRSQVNKSFTAVQTWYEDVLGKTFNLLPAIVYRSALTEAQLVAKYPGGGGMWYDGLAAATAANNLELCSDHRFYYFVTPLDNVWGGWVGAENLGCKHVIPGTASIQSHMGRLVGGIIDPDWPEWWADEIREAQGGVAHEIGHGLGGYCSDGVCNGLPHAKPGDGSIMFEWWDFGIRAGFTDGEKPKILLSPFIL